MKYNDWDYEQRMQLEMDRRECLGRFYKQRLFLKDTWLIWLAYIQFDLWMLLIYFVVR